MKRALALALVSLGLLFARAASLPAGYQAVTYIEATGTQYINTGVVPGPTMAVEMDFTENYLWVRGAPDEYGTPICGSLTGYGGRPVTNGMEVAASVPVVTGETATVKYTLVGWKLTVRHGDGTSTVTQNDAEHVADCTFTPAEGDLVTLEWQWSLQFRIGITAGSGGMVSTTGGWYTAGSTVTVTATATEPGRAFSRWTGDVPVGQELKPTLVFTSDQPRTVTAVFGWVLHVTPTGAGLVDGSDWANAYSNLQDAVDAAVDEDVILMTNGTYALFDYAGVKVTNNLVIRPADPSATVVIRPKAATGGYTGTRRLLTINAPRARIEGLTLAEAYASDNPAYSLVDSAGYALLLKAGTVTNCVITDCKTILGNHVVKVMGGVITRSEVRNTRVTGGSAWNHTTTVYMVGGAMEGCVVSNNQARGRGTVFLDGAGVRLLDSRIVGNRLLPVEGGSCAGGVTIYNGALAEGCTISGNWAETATVTSYTVAGGVFLNGGSATLRRSIVSDNTAVSGYAGGVYLISGGVRAENCLITGNRSLSGACGGVYMSGASANLLNCTLFANVAEMRLTGHGLTMTAGTAKNLILYANGLGDAAFTGGNLVRTGGTVSYSCVTPALDANGSGNVEGNPCFADAAAGDFRLLFGSPCRDTGETIAGLTNDLAGVTRPQGAAFDMGCHEAVPASGPDCAIVIDSPAVGVAPLTVDFSALADPGAGIADYTWTVTDGVTTNSDTVLTGTWSHTFNQTGCYRVSLRVRYGDAREAAATAPEIIRVLPATAYVSRSGTHVWPFDTEAHAATNFHEAIAAVFADPESPGTVKVMPGIYGVAHGLPAGANHLVLLDRPVRLVGQGARPADTVIDGAHLRRILRITDTAARVENLTLARGDNQSGGIVKGYGVEMLAGTVSGCVITNGWSPDAASSEAMVVVIDGRIEHTGICGNRNGTTVPWTRSGATVRMSNGTITECRIFDNVGRNVNGLVYLTGGSLTRSAIFGNRLMSTESQYDGSAGVTLRSSAVLADCVITNNVCDTSSTAGMASLAGGVNLYYNGGTVLRCIIRGNRVGNGDAAGAVMGQNAVLANSLIADNKTGTSRGIAGGVRMLHSTARMLNCTVAGNINQTVTTGHGVAMSAGMITNCIVYGNGPDETRFTTNNLDVTGGVVAYTCSMPRPTGTGNLGADPRFMSPDAGDYHLRSLTPCRRAGVELAEFALDLDGVPRRSGHPYDLGCYTAGAHATLLLLH